MSPRQQLAWLRRVCALVPHDSGLADLLAVLDSLFAADGQRAPSATGALDTDALLSKETSVTARERQILARIGQGEGTKTIANALNLSINTVYGYELRMRLKLGLSDSECLRHAAIRLLAVSSGLAL